jgi:pimeloyl-ACP methyl ester carboxylesterase
MPTLALDDRRLSYEDYGSGPVALLIHGSPGSARAWARVGQRLAERYRVVAPDLPGYGESTPQPAGHEPDVGHACALVEALAAQLGPPAVLAGHSYGGVVALGVALRGRIPVGGLVLFEPVALNMLTLADDVDAYATARAIFDDYIRRVEGGESAAVRTMIDFWFGEGAFGNLPAPLTTYLVKESAANARDVRATFRERYSPEAFRRLTMPVVIVVGDRSPEITHRIATRIAAQVPHGSVRRLPSADHALTTTHVDAAVDVIVGVARRDPAVAVEPP